MRLLFVDACPRGEGVSRTLAVANAFLARFAAHPGAAIARHDLNAMGLLPLDGTALARREELIDARAFDDALFAPAQEFASADGIVVAAPYWDLMFPAALKTYIEHVFIRELTFRYSEDRPIGLCRARRAVYITTAGSPVAGRDFGTAYIKETFAMLGVSRFDSVCAQGLDMRGADVSGLLHEASQRAAAIATDWQRAL